MASWLPYVLQKGVLWLMASRRFFDEQNNFLLVRTSICSMTLKVSLRSVSTRKLHIKMVARWIGATYQTPRCKECCTLWKLKGNEAYNTQMERGKGVRYEDGSVIHKCTHTHADMLLRRMMEPIITPVPPAKDIRAVRSRAVAIVTVVCWEPSSHSWQAGTQILSST